MWVCCAGKLKQCIYVQLIFIPNALQSFWRKTLMWYNLYILLWYTRTRAKEAQSYAVFMLVGKTWGMQNFIFKITIYLLCEVDVDITNKMHPPPSVPWLLPDPHCKQWSSLRRNISPSWLHSFFTSFLWSVTNNFFLNSQNTKCSWPIKYFFSVVNFPHGLLSQKAHKMSFLEILVLCDSYHPWHSISNPCCFPNFSSPEKWIPNTL